jgi:hypothetical protein
MTKSQNKSPKIETPKGVGQLENIYVSELGFLMLRINNLDGTFTTYNLGNYDPSNNIFSNEILKDELQENQNDN